MTERLTPRVGNLAAFLGAVGIVVGAIGPWITVSVLAFSHDIAGTDLDGRYTLALGIAAALCALLAMTETDWPGWLLVGLGLATIGVGIYDALDLGGSAAWGLVLTIAAGAVVAIGGISELFEL